MESFFKNVVFLFCFLLVVKVVELQVAKDECQTKKCHHHNIRFSFRLKGQQPEHCGYHAFELSCKERRTVLELPRNVKLFVKCIDYQAKRIQLYDPKGCLPLQLSNLNLSASPFRYLRQTPFSFNYAESKHSLFNCSREATAGERYATHRRQRYVKNAIGCRHNPRALKPARYSYADIKRITDQFRDKLGGGAYGTVFKGRLSNDVLVAVKVLNNFKATREEFINEVGSMCRIHHVNVTRLMGFCVDGNKRALVYEYAPNESLEKFIFATRDQNHNFNPKISDFGLAKLCSKEQSAVSMTEARGTMGYIGLEWYPTDRPSMKSVVHMLEGEADSLTMPRNPFGHADGALTSANIPRRPINRELPVISELE
ncbi:hypothetical protein SLA2020_287040 [Shorea laevis]